MKIEYLHRVGGSTHQGPSGESYEFQEDAEGRRVAEVKNMFDQERFLSLSDNKGQPLFADLTENKPTETTQPPAEERKLAPSKATNKPKSLI